MVQRMLCSLLLIVAMLFTASLNATQIQDVADLKGDVAVTLIGQGLVVGLNGTGDGDKFGSAQRGLAQMTKELFGDTAVTAAEMEDTKNVALVTITARIPKSGGVNGQRIDVQVSSMGSAKSLDGGRLLPFPMFSPRPADGKKPLAYASGRVTVDGEERLASGTIKGGAILKQDFKTRFINQNGQIQLHLTEANASWPMANQIANMINQDMAPEGRTIARAMDQKTILIQVPRPFLLSAQGPGVFITRVLTTDLQTDVIRTAAQVRINEKTGTIVMTGDVEISPVLISHKGLTINTLQDAMQPDEQEQGELQDPEQNQPHYFALLHQKSKDNPTKGNLRDLLEALDRLKVPAQDRIDIVRMIHKSQKLHAQLIEED